MPVPIEPQCFVNALLPVVRQCAQASLVFYGQVADIGKPADLRLTGTLAQQASTVLTALDSAIQDILLSVVLQRFPSVRCIAEEATPLRRRFAGSRSEYAVIVDPIDGTVHFRNGDAPYHISIGLAHRGTMLAAVVARPTEGKIFTAARGAGAWVHAPTAPPRRLSLPPRPRTNAAYISSKARAYRDLARPELEPTDHPVGAALVLTRLAEGALCAYLTRQVEVYDVGPPSLIAEEAGARCFLRNGRAPRYGRRCMFAFFMAAAGAGPAAKLRAMLRAALPGGTP